MRQSQEKKRTIAFGDLDILTSYLGGNATIGDKTKPKQCSSVPILQV